MQVLNPETYKMLLQEFKEDLKIDTPCSWIRIVNIKIQIIPQ